MQFETRIVGDYQVLLDGTERIRSGAGNRLERVFRVESPILLTALEHFAVLQFKIRARAEGRLEVTFRGAANRIMNKTFEVGSARVWMESFHLPAILNEDFGGAGLPDSAPVDFIARDGADFSLSDVVIFYKTGIAVPVG